MTCRRILLSSLTLTAVRLPYRGVHCSAGDFAIYFHPNLAGAIAVLVLARPWQFMLRQKGKFTASMDPYFPN